MGYKIAIEGANKYLEQSCNAFGSIGYIWQERGKASNVLRSCRSNSSFKDFKDRLILLEVADPGQKETAEAVQRLKTEEGRQELLDVILSLAKLVPTPKALVAYYGQQLSEIDREKEKLLDVVEFQEMSENEELTVYQELREVLAKRRKIKDFLSVISAISPNYACILSAAKLISNRDKRTYTPRVIQPLSEINQPKTEEKRIIPLLSDQEIEETTDHELLDLDLADELKDQIRHFAEVYAKKFRDQHQLKKDGTWSDLGQAQQVYQYVLVYETWQKLLARDFNQAEIIGQLTKLIHSEKVNQLLRGTGHISNAAKDWQQAKIENVQEVE